MPPAGACLGTGVERGKVGDILLVGEQGAQILVAASLVEHLEQTLSQASTQVPPCMQAQHLACVQGQLPRCSAGGCRVAAKMNPKSLVLCVLL